MDARQRYHDLREIVSGLRYIARCGRQWRQMPNDLPIWQAVYQQTRRWMAAGVFESIVHDFREIIWLAQGRAAKRGFVLQPRRGGVERSFAWTKRFRRQALDDERLHTTLEGFRSIAFALLALKAAFPILALR